MRNKVKQYLLKYTYISDEFYDLYVGEINEQREGLFVNVADVTSTVTIFGLFDSLERNGLTSFKLSETIESYLSRPSVKILLEHESDELITLDYVKEHHPEVLL